MFKFPKPLVDFFINLKSNYWFIPGAMTILSIVMSFTMVFIDKQLGQNWPRDFDYLYLTQPEGARALLSTIAGSMITVAGVTFSMTLLSVSHASSQIGPRILSGFMSDRGNQVTLGIFISTFVYCLLVLRTIHGHFESIEGFDKIVAFVPHLSVFMAIIMALFSVSFLIYFIHHVPQTISMTAAVDRVGDELLHKIKIMFPKNIGVVKNDSVLVPDYFKTNRKPVHIEGRGFIKYIDGGLLLEIASEENIIIELISSPGDYVLPSVPFAYYSHFEKGNDEKLEEKIRECLLFGSERTAVQDLYFPTDLLIEVAARALSPGVNDPFTAMECIDQLCAGLVKIAERDIPDSKRLDEEKKLRLIIPVISKTSFLDHFCDKLRSFCKTDLLTAVHLMEKLGLVKKAITSFELQNAITAHIQYVYDDTRKVLDSDRDLVVLKDAYDKTT